MPTINGVPPRLTEDQTAFMRDRRRPDRITTDNPHLIAIMRGEASEHAAPFEQTAPLPERSRMIWVFVACAAFWAAVGAAAALF